MAGATLGAAREVVAGVLREHLPTWRILDDESNPDTLDRTTVLVSITGVARHPQAPMGAWETTVQVTLASPKFANLDAAERDLERDLGDLLAVIEQHLAPWEPATKALYAGRYLCWDIPIRIATTRKG